MKVWIVGKGFGYDPSGKQGIELQGVFSTEAKAEAACRDESYFMAPMEVDEVLPDETMADNWPGHRWPVLEKQA